MKTISKLGNDYYLFDKKILNYSNKILIYMKIWALILSSLFAFSINANAQSYIFVDSSTLRQSYLKTEDISLQEDFFVMLIIADGSKSYAKLIRKGKEYFIESKKDDGEKCLMKIEKELPLLDSFHIPSYDYLIINGKEVHHYFDMLIMGSKNSYASFIPYNSSIYLNRDCIIDLGGDIAALYEIFEEAYAYFEKNKK
ncbi:hypothetical protein [Chitinophaga sancti]|uniref:Uncharacterized protein n=1 Tax=Chitinophaga sancti TaxID=1004 RepID=A0A1K1SCJ5_9BACT|nr:hypothetical protein [Chitinophaga sancti]WQD63609.1 hypothetical protein U0033_04320 [Chitinophaga sancti]WQG90766.1 hypothetical protein SR876_04600 [Chitinophaga sancti]SFW82030.1 hypothetical protein SAMN05661012_05183 [Chitinophaga sancti]